MKYGRYSFVAMGRVVEVNILPYLQKNFLVLFFSLSSVSLLLRFLAGESLGLRCFAPVLLAFPRPILPGSLFLLFGSFVLGFLSVVSCPVCCFRVLVFPFRSFLFVLLLAVGF